jgi:hypothetical protein
VQRHQRLNLRPRADQRFVYQALSVVRDRIGCALNTDAGLRRAHLPAFSAGLAQVDFYFRISHLSQTSFFPPFQNSPPAKTKARKPKKIECTGPDKTATVEA